MRIIVFIVLLMFAPGAWANYPVVTFSATVLPPGSAPQASAEPAESEPGAIQRVIETLRRWVDSIDTPAYGASWEYDVQIWSSPEWERREWQLLNDAGQVLFDNLTREQCEKGTALGSLHCMKK